ncbi:hypothetical protein HMPREF9080_02793 [Cardiobacterium valvarum F0432]|uniref:Uncharacterized protein n=1 Tax=Cardiobacterium valvarum F0432 TaxID=797473 RepID=G9ZJ24_9GAMM|nr:hypothetical protein HMPREF9080_02793 [Cardiobacterium valvarum F0432]
MPGSFVFIGRYKFILQTYFALLPNPPQSKQGSYVGLGFSPTQYTSKDKYLVGYKRTFLFFKQGEF